MTKRAARRQRARSAPVAPAAAPPREIVVPHQAVALAKLASGTAQAVEPFKPAIHPPGVAPEPRLAMDDAFTDTAGWAITGLEGYGVNGLTAFLGFPVLAELAQRPEYRRVSETIATEMTRRWIRVTAKGDKDKTERVEAIVADLERFGIRDLFRRATEHDGFFGRAHIYVDLAGGDSPGERTSPIGNGRDAASLAKVRRDALRGFRVVEPIWCYPGGYNTSDPLSPDWYKPTVWYVQGKAVHATRLLTLVAREVPDLLKPAYSFGGVSLSQMIRPYVDIWRENQTSVAELIRSFSVSGVKLDLVTALASGGADNLQRRVELFTAMRRNMGTMVLDKGNGGNSPPEEFFNVSTPLGTLDVLLAQSQEHIASTASIPLIKYTGLQPSGLNASSDGEIRSWYDWIHAKQEDDYRRPLTTVIDFIQLSRFGDVDPDITFAFEPLWTMDEKEQAEVEEIKARTAQTRIDSNVLLPSEERQRVAREEGTDYPGLDLTLDVDDAGGEGDLDEPPAPNETEGGDDTNQPRGDIAADAGWEENDHPRAENGQFGSGSSSGAAEHDDEDEDDQEDDDEDSDDLDTPSYDLHQDEVLEPSDDDEDTEANLEATIAKHDPSKIVLHAPLSFDEDGEIDRGAMLDALMSSIDSHRNAPGFLSDESKEHDSIHAHNAALDYLNQYGAYFNADQDGHHLVLAFERGDQGPYWKDRQDAEARLREAGHDDASVEREISGEADKQRKLDAMRQHAEASYKRYQSTDDALSEAYPAQMREIEAAREKKDFRQIQLSRSQLIKQYEAEHGVKLSYDAALRRQRKCS